MNIYDKANELAACMKQTEEYREYIRLKDIAYADETNKSLLNEFKKLQYQAQFAYAAGQTPDEDDMKRLQAIGGILQFNQDVSAFMLAELRFQKMLADIYKILGDVAGIDLDALHS